MSIYNQAYLLVLISYTLFSFSSCDTTDPEYMEYPRDYTWIADTIYNPNNYQTLMSSIWGSSENDIYMCGHSSGSPGGLWHYNGTKWEMIKLGDFVGSSGILASVHGSSADNIWVVGYRGSSTTEYRPYIVNFNGFSWTKHELNINMDPVNVYVAGKNDVWICGSYGITGHFDNVSLSWQIDTVYTNTVDDSNLILNSILKHNNEIYVFGYKVIGNGLSLETYLFKKSTSGWNIIGQYSQDSLSIEAKLFSFENNLYSVGQSGVYKWINDQWGLSIPTDKSISNIGQSSLSNMLLISGLGYVYHYNGNDVKQLSQLTNEDIIYSGVWMNKNLAVVIGWLTTEIPQKSIVFIGM